MAEEKTTPQTGSETGTEAAQTSEADAKRQRELSAFGFESDGSTAEQSQGSGDPTGDKPAGNDDKGTTDQESGDPSKKETTSTDGSGQEGEGQEQKRYAGKYNSPEALEQGYSTLFTHTQKVEAENKAFRDKLAELEAKAKDSTGASTATETTSGSGHGSTAANLPPDALKAREELEAALGDDGIAALETLLNAHSSRKTASDELEARLARMEQKEFEQELQTRHPEVKEEMIQKTLDEINAEFSKNGDDRVFQMSLLVDAAKGRNLAAYIEKAVDSAKERIRKEVRAELQAGGLVAGEASAGTGQSGTGQTEPGERERQLKAFFSDPSQIPRI